MCFSFSIFMSVRADYCETCGLGREVITMYSRDIKGSIKLVRSDTNNYQVVGAGSRVLSNFL